MDYYGPKFYFKAFLLFGAMAIISWFMESQKQYVFLWSLCSIVNLMTFGFSALCSKLFKKNNKKEQR